MKEISLADGIAFLLGLISFIGVFVKIGLMQGAINAKTADLEKSTSKNAVDIAGISTRFTNFEIKNAEFIGEIKANVENMKTLLEKIDKRMDRED